MHRDRLMNVSATVDEWLTCTDRVTATTNACTDCEHTGHSGAVT